MDFQNVPTDFNEDWTQKFLQQLLLGLVTMFISKKAKKYHKSLGLLPKEVYDEQN